MALPNDEEQREGRVQTRQPPKTERRPHLTSRDKSADVGGRTSAAIKPPHSSREYGWKSGWKCEGGAHTVPAWGVGEACAHRGQSERMSRERANRAWGGKIDVVVLLWGLEEERRLDSEFGYEEHAPLAFPPPTRPRAVADRTCCDFRQRPRREWLPKCGHKRGGCSGLHMPSMMIQQETRGRSRVGEG